MTPRALDRGGRAGTEPFPESAKELGRRLGLVETVYIWRARPTHSGGVYEPNWVKDSTPIRANFLSYKRARHEGLVADKVDESTSHIVTVDATAEVSPPDRYERQLDGTFWEVIAVEDRTDQPTVQTQAKEVAKAT